VAAAIAVAGAAKAVGVEERQGQHGVQPRLGCRGKGKTNFQPVGPFWDVKGVREMVFGIPYGELA
jgi:2-keto-4-pentenoate hydratase/2-oxohepta-3-ene-1,7-dioic acid hydratase in catechol pathway